MTSINKPQSDHSSSSTSARSRSTPRKRIARAGSDRRRRPQVHAEGPPDPLVAERAGQPVRLSTRRRTPTAWTATRSTAKGWGHGVGMCQVGAYGMAFRGWTFDRILKHYYTGIEIVPMSQRAARRRLRRRHPQSTPTPHRSLRLACPTRASPARPQRGGRAAAPVISRTSTSPCASGRRMIRATSYGA